MTAQLETEPITHQERKDRTTLSLGIHTATSFLLDITGENPTVANLRSREIDPRAVSRAFLGSIIWGVLFHLTGKKLSTRDTPLTQRIIKSSPAIKALAATALRRHQDLLSYYDIPKDRARLTHELKSTRTHVLEDSLNPTDIPNFWLLRETSYKLTQQTIA